MKQYFAKKSPDYYNDFAEYMDNKSNVCDATILTPSTNCQISQIHSKKSRIKKGNADALDCDQFADKLLISQNCFECNSKFIWK